jgi:hypothetical protein
MAWLGGLALPAWAQTPAPAQADVGAGALTGAHAEGHGPTHPATPDEAASTPWPDPEGQPQVEPLSIGRAQIELQFAPGFDARLQADARAWVRRSAEATARYFGSFPVPHSALLLVPVEGAGVRSGVSHDAPLPRVRVRLGRETTAAQLLADAALVHEMVHLALPRLPRPHDWLPEGLATYVEGVVRCRAGLLTPGQLWRQWALAMPQGQPQPGDAGLDHAATWARTRWGGAMFCLLADVELLQRSARRAGLQQALQGVLAAGGSCAVAWPVARMLATADDAVGLTTLTDLYERMKDSSAPIDLDGLWRGLGVGDGVLRDDAPLAAVRSAIL